jgi:microcin C transport system permease protein
VQTPILHQSEHTTHWRAAWARFCLNRRAYYALIVVALAYGISLLSGWIASDRPLIVAYKHRLYFPIFRDYADTVFGGDLQSSADYDDPFVVQSIREQGWMIRSLIPYSIQTVDYRYAAPAPPSREHWLGTDDQGRDVFARLLYGFRTSMTFSLLLTFVASLVGFILGAIQGYFGGGIDLILQRIIEIWTGLPVLYLLMILSSIVEPNLSWLLAVLSCFSWMPLSVVVRAECLRTRSLDFVKAVEILGASPFRIIWRHVLPNAAISTITYVPFLLNHAIIMLTALDFLGFGLPMGSASLGELMTQGKNNLHAPWLGITAFAASALVLTSLVFIGEGVRDAWNPRRSLRVRQPT